MRQEITMSDGTSIFDEHIANGISREEVNAIIRYQSNKPLLLDCRPFIAYNETHIVEAVNVHCPPILKRRSNGFIPLENIVPCEHKRKLLVDGHFECVIVYDADTQDLSRSSKDSNIYPVLKSLRQQVELSQVSFIIGGFNEFKCEFPDMCIGQNCSQTKWTLPHPPTRYNARESLNKEGPVEILPGLFLGDSQHSAQQDILKQLGITCLLNVSTTCKNFFENDFYYMNIPVNDNDSANISSWFNEAIGFIDNARDNDGKVLVHCQAGVSRSATVCIAYIMFKKGMNLEDAFDHVRSRRGVISPNLNFMQQLKEFEKDILGAKEYRIPDTVSSISDSLASVDFDASCSSTSISDFSSSSSAFDFTFASSTSPQISPQELISPS